MLQVEYHAWIGVFCSRAKSEEQMHQTFFGIENHQALCYNGYRKPRDVFAHVTGEAEPSYGTSRAPSPANGQRKTVPTLICLLVPSFQQEASDFSKVYGDRV